MTGIDPLGTASPLPESPEECVAALERAGGLRRRRWKGAPRRVIPAEAERAASLGKAATILRRLGRQEEALAPAYASVNVLLRLAPYDDTVGHAAQHADAWIRAGIISTELGWSSTGTAAMRRAVATRRSSAHTPADKGALAVDLAILGRTLFRSGELDDGLACVRESMMIRRSLGERVPPNADQLVSTARALLDAVAADPNWRGQDADRALRLIDQALLG